MSGNDNAGSVRKIITEANPTKTVVKTVSKQNTDPIVGLARVGSRAALNFSFAFLKRAWRSGEMTIYSEKRLVNEHFLDVGEDTDLCGELLSESLEALQLLPPAALFDDSDVSPVWLEVVERSSKFLRQVVLG